MTDDHRKLCLLQEKSKKLIENLEAQNSELERLLKSNESELLTQNTAREIELSNARLDLENMRLEKRSEIVNLQHHLEELKLDLESVSSERQKLQGQCEKMATSQQRLEVDNQHLKKTCDQLQADWETCRAQVNLEQERVKLAEAAVAAERVNFANQLATEQKKFEDILAEVQLSAENDRRSFEADMAKLEAEKQVELEKANLEGQKKFEQMSNELKLAVQTAESLKSAAELRVEGLEREIMSKSDENLEREIGKGFGKVPLYKTWPFG